MYSVTYEENTVSSSSSQRNTRAQKYPIGICEPLVTHACNYRRTLNDLYRFHKVCKLLKINFSYSNFFKIPRICVNLTRHRTSLFHWGRGGRFRDYNIGNFSSNKQFKSFVPDISRNPSFILLVTFLHPLPLRSLHTLLHSLTILRTFKLLSMALPLDEASLVACTVLVSRNLL